MRALLVPFLALLCAVPGATAASAETELGISFWAQGTGTVTKSWTLRCDPAGGTLPSARRTCTQLAGLRDAFRPVPKDAICTLQYGGPQRALVRGTFRGRRIWTRFNREDGCQISRWNRHRFLFPALLVSGVR